MGAVLITQRDIDRALNCNKILYVEDCEFIVESARQNDILISLKDAQLIWRYYSGEHGSSWLDVDCAEEVMQALKVFVNRKEKNC